MDRRDLTNSTPDGSSWDSDRPIRARAWRFVFDCHERREAASRETDQKAREDGDDRSQNGPTA